MKRFKTETCFIPLKVSEDFSVTFVKDKDGKEKKFRTRKAVEQNGHPTNLLESAFHTLPHHS